MKIVNLIHIGDEVKRFEELSPEEQSRIATALNAQALEQLGYVAKPEKERPEKERPA